MKTDFFITGDGVRLAYVSKHVQNSRIGVLLLHGLAEHKGRYEEFIEKLAAAGISVFAVDLRGHGESDGIAFRRDVSERVVDVESFDDYLKDLDSFVKHIKAEYPKLKLALFGHSLGGLIAANYVADGGQVNFLILSSPSLETPEYAKFLRFVPRRILGKFYIKKRRSESKEMLAYNRRDPQSCKYFTLRLAKSAFIDGVRRVSGNFGKIKIPVLMLGGKLDNMINSGRLSAILEKFGSTDKTLLIYENAIHRIVQNTAKDKAIPDIINWLKAKSR